MAKLNKIIKANGFVKKDVLKNKKRKKKMLGRFEYTPSIARARRRR